MATEKVTLYHKSLPEGENVTTVPEKSASVLEKSGWTRDLPKKYQDADATKEA